MLIKSEFTVKDLQSKLKDSTRRCGDLLKRSTKAHADLAAFEVKSKKIFEENEKLLKDVDSFKSVINVEKNRVSNLKTRNHTLQQRIDSLVAKNESLRLKSPPPGGSPSNNKLKKQLATAKQLLAETRKTLAQRVEQVKNLQAKTMTSESNYLARAAKTRKEYQKHHVR